MVPLRESHYISMLMSQCCLQVAPLNCLSINGNASNKHWQHSMSSLSELTCSCPLHNHHCFTSINLHRWGFWVWVSDTSYPITTADQISFAWWAIPRTDVTLTMVCGMSMSGWRWSAVFFLNVVFFFWPLIRQSYQADQLLSVLFDSIAYRFPPFVLEYSQSCKLSWFPCFNTLVSTNQLIKRSCWVEIGVLEPRNTKMCKMRVFWGPGLGTSPSWSDLNEQFLSHSLLIMNANFWP